MRKAELERNTKETQIKLSLALDGIGESNLKADLPFFVHMIDQLSNHHVIPVYLSSENEIKKLPNYGFKKFIDAELNIEREIFLRPKVKNKLLLDYQKSKEEILHIFSKNQLMQLELDNGINLSAIQQYFMRAVI